MNGLEKIHPVFFIIIATILEVCGDKIISNSLHNHSGIARLGPMLIGATLLFGYGFFLNLSPLAFGKIVGLYITTLFIVWQIVTCLTTRSAPAMPVIIGGALIVAGGMIITFWDKQ